MGLRARQRLSRLFTEASDVLVCKAVIGDF